MVDQGKILCTINKVDPDELKENFSKTRVSGPYYVYDFVDKTMRIPYSLRSVQGSLKFYF